MTFQTRLWIEQATAQPGHRDSGVGLLSQFGLRMAYARDEEVYAQEEAADLIYQVVSGAVRTSRLGSDGRRQIGDFYYPGDIFGLEQTADHRFSAETLSDAVILVARKRALIVAAGADAVERFVAAATARDLRRTQDHLLLLSRKTACEKVASFLLDAANRQPGQPVNLPMGRQDMADYLGLTIETVSRMVTQLQATSVVEFHCCRTFIVRNTAALERLSQ